MTMDGAVVVPATSQGAQWVDEVLLAGPASDICFRLPEPIDRAKLRRLVRVRQSELAEAGLRAGGAAALRLPPSMAFVTHLLAVWRSGGQAILLDHRLTDYEVRRAIERLVPQVVVSPTHPVPAGAACCTDCTPASSWSRRHGSPATRSSKRSPQAAHQRQCSGFRSTSASWRRCNSHRSFRSSSG